MRPYHTLSDPFTRTIRLFGFVILLFTASDLCGQGLTTSDSIGQERADHVFPEAIGFVNDFSGLLSDSLEAELANALIEYEARTTREIAVVLVDDLGPYTDIVQYGTDLGNAWGIGKKDLNNGVVLVLCVPLRKVGISVGLGAEQVLTDSVCQAIIDELMMPKFRQQDYFFGLRAGINTIMGVWDE